MGRLIRTDFHVHTNHSACGDSAATPWAVVRAAQEAGLEAIGITDHVAGPGDFERPRLVREELPRRARGLGVYVGCEAEMRGPDDPSISREYAAEMDFVMFSASHLHNIGPVGQELAPALYLERREMAEFILGLMRGAIGTGYADIIAHPFHVPMCRFPFREIVEAVEEEDLKEVAEAAAEAGVAMECNPRFVREAPEAAAWLVRRFLGAGCKLSLGSDAHHPSGVGCRGLEFATEAELRGIGIGEECLWRIEDSCLWL